MKFRKKPVVIEAFQMTPDRRESNTDWPEWLNRAWNKHWMETGAVFSASYHFVDCDPRQIAIRTLEGIHLVSWGDWIIQGVKGELYPCKPEIFEMTYEPAEEGEA